MAPLDVWELTKVVGRRWYIAGPVFLVAVLLTFGISTTIDPEYQSEAVVLLLPPIDAPSGDGDGANPYAVLPISTVAESLRYSLTSQGVLQQLQESGLTSNVTVETDPTRPILSIGVAGDSSEDVAETTALLIDESSSSLHARQESYTDGNTDYEVTTSVVSKTGSPVQDFGSRTRIRLVLLAIGAILAVAIAIIADVFLGRHESTVEAGGTAGDEAATRPTPPAPDHAEAERAEPDPRPSPPSEDPVESARPSRRRETTLPWSSTRS